MIRILSMRHRLGVLCLGLLAVMVWTSPAVAQSSATEGMQLYRQGNLPGALEAFEAALATGEHEGAALAQLYWHLGVLLAIVGNPEGAEDNFARALSLDASLPLPEELPPEGQALFRQAQERVRSQGAEGFRLRLDAAPTPGVDAPVALTIDGAPSGFVASWELLATPPSAAPWRQRYSGETTEVVLAGSAWRGARQLRLRATAFDRHGNVLGTTETSLRGAPEQESTPLVGTEDTGSRPAWKSPWLWTGVGAAIVAGVVTAIVLTRPDDRFELRPMVE